MNFFDIAKEGDRVKLRNGAMGEITCLATGHEPIGGVIDGSGDIQWWGTHGQWNHITKVHPLDIVDIIGKTEGGKLIAKDERPAVPYAKYDATWKEITVPHVEAGDEVVMRSGLTAAVTGKGNVCITGTYTDSRGAQRHTAWHLTGFARGEGHGQDDYDIMRCFRKRLPGELLPVVDDPNYSVNYAALLASDTTRGPDDAVIYPKALLRSGEAVVIFMASGTDPAVKCAITGKIGNDSWCWNVWGKSYDNEPQHDIVGISLREMSVPEAPQAIEEFKAPYGTVSINSPKEPTPSATIASVLFAETPEGVMNIAKHGNATPVAPSSQDMQTIVRDTAIELVARLMAKHDGWLPDANSIKATQTTIPGVCVIDTGAEPSPIWHRYVERASEYVALILK